MLKNKARCYYCRRITDSILNELKNRKIDIQEISIEINHIRLGESPALFDELIDNFISKH